MYNSGCMLDQLEISRENFCQAYSVLEVGSVESFRAFHMELVSSTMDVALELARWIPRGNFVLTAAEQTQGRGKYGRVWHSPRGNLYATFAVCNGVKAPSKAFYLLMACAVRDALKNFRIVIKEPNDLYMDGKKLGGVLIECHGDLTLIGVGVNLKAHPPYATSVHFHSQLLLRSVARNLESYFRNLMCV